MVTREQLLSKLPPYQDKWVTVKKKQRVKDIIKSTGTIHQLAAPYYDLICEDFDKGTTAKICNEIFRFEKKYFHYVAEEEEDQTLSVPQGLLTGEDRDKLTPGFDCKSYATFCGGILDALNRQGKNIDWCYRFASYDPLEKTHYHHVFVVVFDPDGSETWIDATPMSEGVKPYGWLDKEIIVPNMALRMNIAGTEAVGAVISPVVDVDQLNFDGSHKYANAFGKYLGLSGYADYVSALTMNWNALAEQVNQLIASGPDPGHTVDGPFLQWLFENSVRSWNLYYVGGVAPGYNPDALLPAGYPRPIMTPDGRLTIDHDAPLDDYRNGEIHLLTAWMQSLINEYDETPYPLKPRDLKLFSQENTGNPNNPKADLFRERRGMGFIKEVGKALEKYINVVKEDVLKIVGSPLRNAFLALVGLNIFNMAKRLQDEINAGNWPEMANKWESIGGNAEKFKNTINHGAGQPEEKPNEAGTLGIVPAAAAWITAAAPIIAMFMKYLNKDGKFNDIIPALDLGLKTAFPDWDFTMLTDGSIVNKKTGHQVSYIVDDKDNENKGGGNNAMPGDNQFLTFIKGNPEITALVTTAGAYLVLNRKGKKQNILIPVVIGGVVYALIKFTGSSSGPNKRQLLIDYVNSVPDTQLHSEIKAHYIQVFTSMSSSEIDTVYDWIFNYVKPGNTIPQSGTLYNKMLVLNSKYDLFGT